jgi:hypothetical protein
VPSSAVLIGLSRSSQLGDRIHVQALDLSASIRVPKAAEHTDTILGPTTMAASAAFTRRASSRAGEDQPLSRL